MDPIQKQSIVFVIFGKPYPSSMRLFADGFVEQQAIGRGCKRKSPPTRVLDDRFVVHIRIKAQQGQSEAVLTASFAMAWAGIATPCCENRLDIQLEFQSVFWCLGGFVRF